MFLELFYRKDLLLPRKQLPHVNAWSPKNLLKKRDGFSLITSFVQSLPSLWPLSVSKGGEPKLLLNLLNSRARAIPTLCYRLLLSVIQMTMTVLPPSLHPKPTQNSVCISAYLPSMQDMLHCLVLVTLATCNKTHLYNGTYSLKRQDLKLKCST